MKRIFYFLVLFVSLVACQKYDIASDQGGSTSKLITLTASIDLSKTKVIPVDPTADTVYFKWQAGDSIFITDFSTYEVFKIVDNSISTDGKTATFTGKALSDMSYYLVLTGYSGSDINELFNGPYNTTYVEGTFHPMGFGSGLGQNFNITGFNPVLKLRVKGNATIGKIEYYYLAGEEEWEEEGYRLSNTLMCKDGISLSSEISSIYSSAPQRSEQAFKLVFYDTDDNVLKIQESTKNIKEVYSIITCPVLEINAITLNGLFSVSADKKVRFSKGNLQYQASTETWRFAENQYDAIGNAAGNNTATGRDTQSDWIDLFGWGATGQNSFGQQPYSISTTDSEYKTVATAASGETLTIENKADWGYCMGGATSVWRTLSGGDSGEWKYLFNEREGASNKVGYATVGGTQNDGSDGVPGIIILPDTFTDPMKNGGSKAFDSKTINWTTNVYTSGDNWNAMEAAGAVFLPITGIRSGSEVSYLAGLEVHGQYWSSTANDDYDACDLYFGCSLGISYFVNPGMIDDRNNGFSVRLVCDANQ